MIEHAREPNKFYGTKTPPTTTTRDKMGAENIYQQTEQNARKKMHKKSMYSKTSLLQR